MRTIDWYPVRGRYAIEIIRDGRVEACIFAGHTERDARATLARWSPTNGAIAQVTCWVNPDMGTVIVAA